MEWSQGCSAVAWLGQPFPAARRGWTGAQAVLWAARRQGRAPWHGYLQASAGSELALVLWPGHTESKARVESWSYGLE